MKKIKTQFAKFVKENYGSYSAFGRAVNSWKGEQVFSTEKDENNDMKGSDMLRRWGAGLHKPSHKKTIRRWRISKEYIRSVHGLNANDGWLAVYSGKQQEIEFSETKTNYLIKNNYIKRLDERYERMRKITEQATKLEYSIIGLKEWTDKVSECSERINRFRDLVKQKITSPHDGADLMVSIRNHGEEDYTELYSYYMCNWDDLMNLIEDRLFIELSNALSSLEKDKDAVTEIAKQWN